MKRYPFRPPRSGALELRPHGLRPCIGVQLGTARFPLSCRLSSLLLLGWTRRRGISHLGLHVSDLFECVEANPDHRFQVVVPLLDLFFHLDRIAGSSEVARTWKVSHADLHISEHQYCNSDLLVHMFGPLALA